MTTKHIRLIALGMFGTLFATCAANQAALKSGQATLSEEQYVADVVAFSADDFEGRKPGEPGGDKAVAYLKKRINEIGLEPGNGDSYVQDVPLISVSSTEDTKIVLRGGGQELAWMPFTDFAGAGDPNAVLIEHKDADLFLVGYGVVDTTYGWDQYGDIDFEGKIVIIFRNDPGFLTENPDWLGEGGDNQHAFWTQKFAAAKAKGAAAAYAIVDTTFAPGGSEFSAYRSANGRIEPAPEMDMSDGDRSNFASGYLNPIAAKAMFAAGGHDYDALALAATEKSFTAVDLGFKVDLNVQDNVVPFASYNVAAMIKGETRPDEIIIYSAHWDHEGIDPSLDGDTIYNGAADNATGSAALLNLANAFNTLEVAPERSILFLWVTAEESGLLGSEYYSDHPIYPLNKTVAAINIDMLIPMGKTRDVIVIGHGKSDLDGYAERAAKKLGMYVQPDLWPDEGFYYRSDHINFAVKGVPALDMGTGVDHLVYGQDSTLVLFEEWQAERYHKVADEFDDTWRMDGIMDYMKISFDIGYTISNEKKWPNWNKDDEFRPVRDESMKAAKGS